MIHIVFNEADINTLQQVMLLDESLVGDIMIVRDDYAVGPLQSIYEPEGIVYRKEWISALLAGGDYDGLVEKNIVNDEQVVADINTRLAENETECIWLWVAPNKHDVCGYFWLISQMKPWQGRIYILFLSNLPFINEKGQLFYPKVLNEILPKEFLKAKKLARLVSGSEFEVDPDEWTKICNEGKMIRTLEGGKKLEQHNEDYYDAELKTYITGEFQKASKIISNYLSKAKETTGDAYILYRLKQIVHENPSYEVQGTVGKMKEFEVKKVNTENVS
jgi:hypothetical protein